MPDCRCLNGKVTISGGVNASATVSPGVKSSASVGTIVMRDGTNDYERLVHKPSIEGHELVGDSTLMQIGVATLTEQEIDRIIYG